MDNRPERTDDGLDATDPDAASSPAPDRPGFARSRRRALALAGAAAIAPGVRAVTPETSDTDPPARLRTGWILRPEDR